jgi:hypothetical protein
MMRFLISLLRNGENSLIPIQAMVNILDQLKMENHKQKINIEIENSHSNYCIFDEDGELGDEIREFRDD